MLIIIPCIVVVVVVVVVEVLGEEGQGEVVVDQCGDVVVLFQLPLNSALWLLHGISDPGSSLQRIILCLYPLLGISGSVSNITSSFQPSLQYGSVDVIEQHPRINLVPIYRYKNMT